VKGERAAALADYEQVLELKDFRGSKAKAKGFIAKPYAVSDEERSRHLPAAGSAVQVDQAPLDGADSGNVHNGQDTAAENDIQDDRATQ
jgi:hypothetical protein